MPHDSRHKGFSRRGALTGFAGAALVFGCSDDGAMTPSSSSGEDSDSDSSTDSSTDPTDSSTDPTGDPLDCPDTPGTWASGGTAAMTAKHCYPDPFAAGVMSCALTCETTPGPCTADAPLREDVSEGLPGLPLRLALLVVDAGTCEPVEGARVEIWHTQRRGIYSGMTPGGVKCYLDDPDAADHLYFRGAQVAGPDGRVNFDTCFPGWYPGRTLHIHLRVYRGADAFVTSQLFFDDALVAEVFAGHPDYAEFGPPDTTNATDSIFGDQVNKSAYTLDTARMPDGAMLAAKVIALRSSLGQPSCSV